MKILLKSAKVIDPNGRNNGKKCDILIENGIIKALKPQITSTPDMKVISEKNLHVSPGWFDMQVNFRDPGYEHKEDLHSGAKAAAAGGFTGVALMPSTLPPLHTKSEIEYVKNKTAALITDVYPVGTISHNHEGKELSEMYDMHKSGAVAFSDDKRAIVNAGLLSRALLYSKNFGGLVMTWCSDKDIAGDGKMNEGVASTKLGLKGIPGLAEELMVARNIHLAEYCEAPIHISSVSTAGSVQLIREARAKKLKVSASVNAYSIALDDSLLKDFNSNYKVNPPLRTSKDIAALWKGLADGTISAITSDHAPQDIESKEVEFDYAANGMTGLETMFALANTHRGKMKLEDLIGCISSAPRKVLGLPAVNIKEGAAANLTLFDPDASWTFTEKDIRSKSKNTPLIGKKLKGKVIGVVNKGMLGINMK